jgi:hypothetical protein
MVEVAPDHVRDGAEVDLGRFGLEANDIARELVTCPGTGLVVGMGRGDVPTVIPAHVENELTGSEAGVGNDMDTV